MASQPSEVYLFSAFSPVRMWTQPLWIEGIRNAEYYITRSVVINNTGDEAFPLIKAFLNEEMDILNRVISIPVVFHDKPANLRARTMAHFWNTGLPLLTKATYILSVEEDVQPSAGFLAQMVEVMDADPSIAVIGLPVKSRHSKCRMVYNATSIDPWILGEVVPESTDKIQVVNSVSTSCTLIRSSALTDFRFTGNPNADGSGGNGHEWSLMKHVQKNGQKVVTLNGVPCKHFVTETTWV